MQGRELDRLVGSAAAALDIGTAFTGRANDVDGAHEHRAPLQTNCTRRWSHAQSRGSGRRLRFLALFVGKGAPTAHPNEPSSRNTRILTPSVDALVARSSR